MVSTHKESSPSRASGSGDRSLNLALERVSTATGFLLISSKLAVERLTLSRYTGGGRLTCDRGQLPEEIARAAEVLGHADEIELRIDVDVRLLSNDLDSKNKIGIVFSGKPFRALIYEFDNDRRGWRSKPPGKRMTLRFIDPTEGKSGGDFKEEEKRLRLKGVFDDVEGAFVRLNTFLNQAPLV